MTAPLLRCDQLSVTHRDAARPTPASVSFEVATGEALLVLGPSGSGKSTLALALNGLVPKSVWADVSGRVELGGRDLVELRLADASAHIAMVFQDADAQIVAGTVYDEVAFGPENLCVPVDEIERRVEAALRAVRLWDRRDDAPEVLSGGGRQRLAIAAAIAQGSPCIVLDEPTANLDPRSAAEVYDVLGELLARGDVGIVLVEHNLDQALRIATRVLVLDHEGRVAVTGSPREVLVDHAHVLAELGVWLPVATQIGARLWGAGVHFDELPLTIDELRRTLTVTSALPEVAERPSPAPADAPEAIGARGLFGQLSFSLPAASFTALVGPNGAGKSTLLHALTGITPPGRGHVFVGGDDLTRLPERELRDRIGIVFQNPEQQFLTGRVWDELALELRSRGLDEAEVEARVRASLERFDLTAHAEQHPFVLSGGQKRRLSVATALVSGASTLVLDEPTFGQDEARAAELVGMLRELVAGGTTVLIATHDLQLAAEEADRVLVLDDARLVADGATHDVIASGVLERVGLGLPPVAAAFRGIAGPHGAITRMREVPGREVWR
ncbi:ABC transporter ATP-binding protein [Gulosibacter massiliensis]|uniref:ABC transporter ATP-binding protein n=1 Tax=Gulosibacter massiliensis TaxID=2479839 RepID=UPI000F643141|nr:energy-coupling factor transporter ATPase [Gulosibacter massiliensis]